MFSPHYIGYLGFPNLSKKLFVIIFEYGIKRLGGIPVFQDLLKPFSELKNVVFTSEIFGNLKNVVANQFLEHKVSAFGIRDTLNSYHLPSDERSLRKFLGISNFYHRFIPIAATLQA